MATESSVDHRFTFTHAISTFVRCSDEEDIDTLFGKLSDGGTVHMPLNEYPSAGRSAGWRTDTESRGN